MKEKSKIDELSLDPETAKNLELDEQPRPVRKGENSTFPNIDSSKTTSHKRIKGTRKAK